jgi:hypothetical protein
MNDQQLTAHPKYLYEKGRCPSGASPIYTGAAVFPPALESDATLHKEKA